MVPYLSLFFTSSLTDTRYQKENLMLIDPMLSTTGPSWLDNAIHQINRYPLDKCQQNKPGYLPDSDLSSR